MKNPNCDNEKCLFERGEVRLVPVGGSSNAILCRACYNHEMAWRKLRNRELGREAFDIPAWESLTIYRAGL